jgi:hypothetical protein
MAREIDLVLKAAWKDLPVVEKSSHAVWTEEELRAAALGAAFSDEDWLAPPTEEVDVSAPYPGCGRECGSAVDYGRYRLVAQTRHFLIFAPEGSDAGIPSEHEERTEARG